MPTRRRVIAAAYLGMLVFGIVLTALGSVLPSLIARFGLDRTAAGGLFSVLSVGILVASVGFGPIVDRYGYKALLSGAILCIALGVEALAFAPTRGLLTAGILGIGLAGGVVNGATNALVADLSESADMGAELSLLGVFFGLGALGMPLLMGLLLADYSYVTLVAWIGAAVALAAVYVLVTPFPAPKQPQGFPLRHAAGLLRDPVLLLLGLTLFFQSGLELTVGGWTATYVQEVLALPGERALFFLSTYWIGMTVARVAMGAILRRADSFRVLMVSIATAIAGSLILISATGAGAAALGCFLIGVGFAAIFPIVLGHVGARHPQVSGTAIGIALVMALAGGSTLPMVTGVLGDAWGLQRSLLVVPAALVCMSVVSFTWRRAIARPAVQLDS